jgi:hypothetical protein
MKGQRIDFLFVFRFIFRSKTQEFSNRYVDEVQDNLLIDAKGGHFSTSTQIKSVQFPQSSEPSAATRTVSFGRGILRRQSLSAVRSVSTI